jgi:hypothetical protein
MTNNKRWYDQDPTVSLAVSILRNASIQNQKLTAEFIIKKGEAYNISEVRSKSPNPGIFSRRWYDIEESVYKALEFLRVADPDVQKALAIATINYLCELDNSRVIKE